MPPSAGSTSLRQHPSQVRALSSLAPRRSVCSANSSATSTPTPLTLAQCCHLLQHTHSVSSTKSSGRSLDCAFRFFHRCGAAFAPVSSSRSRHRRRPTQARLPQVRVLVATTAPIPAPHTELAANHNRLAPVAPRLPHAALIPAPAARSFAAPALHRTPAISAPTARPQSFSAAHCIDWHLAARRSATATSASAASRRRQHRFQVLAATASARAPALAQSATTPSGKSLPPPHQHHCSRAALPNAPTVQVAFALACAPTPPLVAALAPAASSPRRRPPGLLAILSGNNASPPPSFGASGYSTASTSTLAASAWPRASAPPSAPSLPSSSASAASAPASASRSRSLWRLRKHSRSRSRACIRTPDSLSRSRSEYARARVRAHLSTRKHYCARAASHAHAIVRVRTTLARSRHRFHHLIPLSHHLRPSPTTFLHSNDKVSCLPTDVVTTSPSI